MCVHRSFALILKNEWQKSKKSNNPFLVPVPESRVVDGWLSLPTDIFAGRCFVCVFWLCAWWKYLQLLFLLPHYFLPTRTLERMLKKNHLLFYIYFRVSLFFPFIFPSRLGFFFDDYKKIVLISLKKD